MVFSARPSWPTSVRLSAGLTRWDRSPPLIDTAVWAIVSSGRSSRRSTNHELPTSSASSIEPAITSMRIRRLRDASISRDCTATSSTVPSGWVSVNARQSPEPSDEVRSMKCRPAWSPDGRSGLAVENVSVSCTTVPSAFSSTA